ncbi:uncharacterized protein SEPMUDRAFT_52824 [Sphaerulina musiva SO2202]|uniref:Uncharacterized protein n=1 Tax=Sphaerulina musiva (strain SO2202) TaxID=692275 RepID=M3BRJ5_SPHMS|nr:uncharacterized protein SEPMUDRAFT_52824 [Sphaerulina musiva SO2202]EMF08743.1 hypothetical protein SEPMUDRAFT_52824 [Sphaerulina musiva SO2202]
MCRTIYWKAPDCGHTWLELARPCGPDMNLLTCPDFGVRQPFGPAEKPRRCRWAPRRACPSCNHDSHDMRKRRMIVVKRYGWRFGLGPAKQDIGVDIITHRSARTPKGMDVVPFCCILM